MNTNPSKPAHHRFRGSPLDKALGAALALVCIAVPPFVYGHIGIIYALIVLNGLLIFGLRETMATERAQAGEKSNSTKDEMSQNGLVVFDGMGSLPTDFHSLEDYLLIEPGKVQLGLLEGMELTDVALAFQCREPAKQSSQGSSPFPRRKLARETAHATKQSKQKLIPPGALP